jgi:hypothetical protein
MPSTRLAGDGFGSVGGEVHAIRTTPSNSSPNPHFRIMNASSSARRLEPAEHDTTEISAAHG